MTTAITLARLRDLRLSGMAEALELGATLVTVPENHEAIADALLLGKPLSADYKSYEVPLNALWIEADFDTRRVLEMLADEPPQVVLDYWTQRCTEDRDLWLQAKRRAIEVKRDLLMLRSVLVDALEDVGVLDSSN